MKIKFLMLFFFVFGLKCFSQPVPTSVAIKSPEVNAFNRFIEMPVSQYSGVPSISIPLYEIQIKGVNVPITLDYHAGGIRVDQDATWVGLGWSLNTGGQVTRKSRGIADEFWYMPKYINGGVKYFMDLPNLSWTPNAENQGMRYDRIKDCKYGMNDYMPDEFYYSIPGYSGRFMFSQQKSKFILFPKEDIDIQSNIVGAGSSLFLKMFLPNGAQAEFGGDEGYSTQPERVSNVDRKIINSWSVRKIRNNYNDSISYSYEQYSYRNNKIVGQQVKTHSNMGLDMNTIVSYDQISDTRVKTISFPGGRIEFLTIPRTDMDNLALGEIKVFDAQNQLLKNIKFNYNYFTGDAFEFKDYFTNGIPENYRYKRLKLESVSIVSLDNAPLKYAFDYYAFDKMPSKYSFSQDHWGFYNGIPNQSPFGFIPNLAREFVGGDRRVVPEFSKAFSLKSIVYPEGGKREFVYENNTAQVNDVPSDLLSTYQDDNFIEKSEGIYVTGWSRNSNYPVPDQIIDKTRYFRKKFTISGTSFPSVRKNWSVSTNFGISPLEENTIYQADNVDFKLEKINGDGTRTLLKTFNTTDPQYPYNGKKRNGIDTGHVQLMLGEYEMTVAVTYNNLAGSPPDLQPYNLSCFVYYRELDKTKNMVNVGGLRVKNINYYDSDGSLQKRKKYAYANPNIPNSTSGKVIAFPQYIQYRAKEGKNSLGAIEWDWIVNYTSSSVVPLETTSGSYSGYEYVDEYDEDSQNEQNNIKTSYRFSFERPYFSSYYPLANMSQYEPREYLRGKLLAKSYFKGSQVIKKEEFEYNYKSPHILSEEAEDYVEEINTDLISWQGLKGYSQTTDFSGFPDDFYDVASGYLDNCVYFRYSAFNNRIEAHYNRPVPGYPGAVSNSYCQYDQTVPYFRRYTGFDKISAKTVTTYDDPTTPVVSIENMVYDKTPVHHQVSKILSRSSQGKEVSVLNFYPSDLALTGDAEIARLALIKQHDYTTALTVKKAVDAGEEISKTEYRVDPITKLVFPYLVKTNTGVNGSDEVRSKFSKFDNKGNVLELEATLGIKVCYLWSYSQQNPIAEIRNADYETVIAALGGQDAVNSFAVKVSPTKAEIDAFVALIRNSKTTLKDAHITSYVYKPFVGMTSSTDPKGMTTYYKYDGLNRLQQIKDQNESITKAFEYHYRP